MSEKTIADWLPLFYGSSLLKRRKENMMRKHMMVLAVTLLSVISSFGYAASPQEEVAAYVATFNYTPDSQAAPGSAGVAIATIGNVVYQTSSKALWFTATQFENLDKAIKEDLPKILTAKGFSVRGPYNSYDLIPYPEKKTTNLFLTPTVEIFITSRGSTPDLPQGTVGIVNVKGKIVLELREITTRELMWSKAVDFKEFKFPVGMIIWPKGVTESDTHDGTKKPIDLQNIKAMNEVAKDIEKQYPDIMASFLKLIDPEEMRIIKKHCQELRSKAGFAMAEEATHVANFSYTPAAQETANSAGATFAVGSVDYKPLGKLLWFTYPQLKNLDKAIKDDLTKILVARGFSVRGPFDSYDLIPYPDKKAIDLWLVPTIELSFKAPEETYSIEDIKIEVIGTMKLKMQEITARELMWAQSIPFKFEFPCTQPWQNSLNVESVHWGKGVVSGKDVDNRELKKQITSIKLGAPSMNEIAKGIEQQYPDLMATISKLIDPEEMRIIKKHCQELRSKKRILR